MLRTIGNSELSFGIYRYYADYGHSSAESVTETPSKDSDSFPSLSLRVFNYDVFSWHFCLLLDVPIAPGFPSSTLRLGNLEYGDRSLNIRRDRSLSPDSPHFSKQSGY